MKATSERALPRDQRRIRLAVAGVIALGFAFLAFRSLSVPGTSSASPLPTPGLPCGLHALTGLPCPFCGGTRAASAILVGDFERAIYLNPLAIPSVAIAAFLAVSLFLEAVFGIRIVPWDKLGRAIFRYAPLWLVLAMAWWIPHLAMALGKPKPELVNLGNPVASRIHSWLFVKQVHGE